MSLHDDLTSVQRRLDDLMRCVARLEEHSGDTLDMRRVRSAASHCGTAWACSRTRRRPPQEQRKVEMVTIPDAPYDRGLWADAEDEGLGSPHRRAP